MFCKGSAEYHIFEVSGFLALKCIFKFVSVKMFTYILFYSKNVCESKVIRLLFTNCVFLSLIGINMYALASEYLLLFYFFFSSFLSHFIVSLRLLPMSGDN